MDTIQVGSVRLPSNTSDKSVLMTHISDLRYDEIAHLPPGQVMYW